ncbi:protoporphyrinogen oxidase [Mammaliicoccus sp. Dog046]|uniref:protoporphyrinogen oxidase n=1 Tax=Mammaliicoccus sp. Dog046 TaxID=3034233 RepID=UPI002B25BE4D|nr:protoporphyrinogen oxidase [Mammaliicoccus sp. Dog046]WQK86334.1 protoporphyrinogen oxidase [Mammaliicoccus sp. Dog046]
MAKRIAIIGAGITGLSTAHYLRKESPDLEIDVFEQSDRVGGKIKTYRENGYTIELGPESYLGRKTIMTELAEEVGIADDLVTNQTGQSYIYSHNKLYPIPGGSIMGIPTEIKPFLKTQLISPVAKLRAGLDYFLPVKPMHTDISIGHFFRQRLGNEVLENLIEPLMAGIYGADIDKLSLKTTFPHFKEQEEQEGGLIKGMIAQKAKTNANKKVTVKPKGQFKQFKHGLESFINTLHDHLVQKNVNVQLESRVEKVVERKDKTVLTVNGEEHEYDGVIITIPHQHFVKWFEDDLKLDYFNYMPSTSVATVVMAFNEDQVVNDRNGTGFVIARTSDTAITACTWTNKKWPHTTPEGKVLLRAYVGKPGSNIIHHKDEEQLKQVALDDLNKIMTINGEPEFSIVTKLPYSMPQYEVGHIDRIRDIQSHIEENYHNLIITGASFDAVGLPDCVQMAKDASDKMLTYLK